MLHRKTRRSPGSKHASAAGAYLSRPSLRVCNVQMQISITHVTVACHNHVRTEMPHSLPHLLYELVHADQGHRQVVFEYVPCTILLIMRF